MRLQMRFFILQFVENTPFCMLPCIREITQIK
jgi:hypothetical protein